MLLNVDHVQNLIANDTCDRFKRLENDEGFELWHDFYTNKFFWHDPDDEEGQYWYHIRFIASIQKRIWENWDELATPRDEYELKYLDENPDFSVVLESANGVLYYVWFSVDWERPKLLYLPIDKPEEN